MTQKEMVLAILKKDGCITTYDAFIDIGCTRLPSRIHEIREGGIDVSSIVCTKKNRFGKTVSFHIYYINRTRECIQHGFTDGGDTMHCKCGLRYENDAPWSSNVAHKRKRKLEARQ